MLTEIYISVALTEISVSAEISAETNFGRSLLYMLHQNQEVLFGEAVLIF